MLTRISIIFLQLTEAFNNIYQTSSGKPNTDNLGSSFQKQTLMSGERKRCNFLVFKILEKAVSYIVKYGEILIFIISHKWQPTPIVLVFVSNRNMVNICFLLSTYVLLTHPNFGFKWHEQIYNVMLVNLS